ncbi:MAG: hypothetical protein RDV48_29155 [Candidatus Eremiobacteraeota bacterium]|nr:hypothetical protein [Candidatus Eremiobacteraeota bacterium]
MEAIKADRSIAAVKGKRIDDTCTGRLTGGKNAGSSWKTVANIANSKKGAVSHSFPFDASAPGSSSASQSIEKMHINEVESDGSTYSKGEMEELINGELALTLTASTGEDINEFLKPGRTPAEAHEHRV